jgi:hypothetical protein
MAEYDWSKLSKLQMGKVAEQFAKLEFVINGFEVFTPHLDHRGVDFVVSSNGGPYFEVQVKSSRGLNYICFAKHKFTPKPNLLAVLVIFFTSHSSPRFFVIPSTVWRKPNDLFVERDKAGMIYKPEWGMNLSRKNLRLLRPYMAGNMLPSLR